MWKIGELARRTGLTVRTLHHYDAIGLLPPAERSEGAHRVYGEDDVRRLYRIVSLRSLGFPLDAIAGVLDRDGVDPRSPTTSTVSRTRWRATGRCAAGCGPCSAGSRRRTS